MNSGYKSAAIAAEAKPLPQPLAGRKAAILVADNFQIHEAYYPYFRLKEAGMDVFFIGDEAPKIYHDYHGEPLVSDLAIEVALEQEFDFIHCPGGFAPMKLRADSRMLQLTRKHVEAGKLLSAICHAGSFLVALEVLNGRRATCYHTLKDDLVNAGAVYIDRAPVIDGNLITAREPRDLPPFMEAVVAWFEAGGETAAKIPRSNRMEDRTIGILLEPRYQAQQVWYPYYRFQSEGAAVQLIGGKKGDVCHSRISQLEAQCDLSPGKALERDFDALLVPGDWAADKMRVNRPFLDLVRRHLESGRLLVSVAEGHSVLISTGVLAGRKIAGSAEMKWDLANCGAEPVDRPVVADRNLITARDTTDLPELLRWVLGYLERA
ncbi:MAG: DJ-1/PfpI family protein [Fidelibacterota bacterium]|nr:MAG: DJ-1/PfpI family protein [Candidatus Neomarinimicrobiota bacterium]